MLHLRPFSNIAIYNIIFGLIMPRSVFEDVSRIILYPTVFNRPVFLPSLSGNQLGKLDPDLYRMEETEDWYETNSNHLGRIWFTVSYLQSNEQLKVIIHKARNLRQVISTGMTPTTNGIDLALLTKDDYSLQDFRVKYVLSSFIICLYLLTILA